MAKRALSGLLMAAFLGSAAWAAQSVPLRAELIARTGDQAAWRLLLVVSPDGGCEARTGTRHVKIAKEACSGIRQALVSERARSEGFSPASELDEVTDDYRYELRVGDRRYAVSSRAVEECAILEGGKLECMAPALVPAQLVLRELKARARDLGLMAEGGGAP